MTGRGFDQSDDGGRSVGRQSWRDLLFLHQPISMHRLRALIPPALEVDTFNDEAWVTLIPLSIFDSGPIGVPSRLALDFLEINLRTYVRSPAGEAGIYFFSLEASSWLAVTGARLAYALPYFPAKMTARKDAEGRIQFQSTRRLGGGAALDLTWRPGAPTGTALPGSLDHFLIERYVLFVSRGRHLYRARVRHRPYPLCRASVEGGRETLLAAAGLPPLTFPPFQTHYSPGVDVKLGWLQRVRAPA